MRISQSGSVFCFNQWRHSFVTKVSLKCIKEQTGERERERERENEPFLKTLWGRKWLALKIQFWWRQKPLEIFWIGETFILDENFRCKKLIETILNKSIDFRIMKTFGIKKPFKQVPLKRFSYLFTTCGPHPLAETQTLTAKTMLWLSIGK